MRYCLIYYIFPRGQLIAAPTAAIDFALLKKRLAFFLRIVYNAREQEIFKLGTERSAKSLIALGCTAVHPCLCCNLAGWVLVCRIFLLPGGEGVKLKAQIMDEAALGRALMRISHEINEHNRGVDNVVLVGVRRRGEPIARRIRENIRKIEDKEIPCGSLDIRFYRDDLSRLAPQPETKRADLPFAVTDRDVVLCDDVIYTGRTARAAIEAIFSLGRPRSIQLAVLVDRGHRELPIRPDYVGKNIPTSRSELVEVRLPEFDGETGVFLMDLSE